MSRGWAFLLSNSKNNNNNVNNNTTTEHVLPSSIGSSHTACLGYQFEVHSVHIFFLSNPDFVIVCNLLIERFWARLFMIVLYTTFRNHATNVNRVVLAKSSRKWRFQEIFGEFCRDDQPQLLATLTNPFLIHLMRNGITLRTRKW